jgi:hypothetical protein
VTDTGSTTSTPSGGTPPNGGFETGTTSPTGWTLGTSATDGSWTWDLSTYTDGTHSVKLTAPGTVDLTTPSLVSGVFALSPGKSYTLSASMRSYQIAGTYPPILWLVELDSSGAVLKNSSGAVIQHSLVGDFGTVSWSAKTRSFITDSRCAKAYVHAAIYSGHGVAWVDDVEVK